MINVCPFLLNKLQTYLVGNRGALRRCTELVFVPVYLFKLTPKQIRCLIHTYAVTLRILYTLTIYIIHHQTQSMNLIRRLIFTHYQWLIMMFKRHYKVQQVYWCFKLLAQFLCLKRQKLI